MKSIAKLTLALALLFALPAAAQDVKYITDTTYVPVRSGQGTQYRIVHRGLPSGTRVTVTESNEESGYSYIVTDRGTEGWVLTRYLMEQEPAADRLAALREEYEALVGDEGSIRAQLVEARDALEESNRELKSLGETLAQTRSELAEVRRVSSNALTLDSTNRRLTEEAQVMRTRIEVLEADNQRLKDSEDGQAFINGALAVLLGVVIALIVPRLRPKPRASSSWV